MKTTRRGLFGLIAGIAGTALLGKEAAPNATISKVTTADHVFSGHKRMSLPVTYTTTSGGAFTISHFYYVAFEIDDLSGGLETQA